MRKINSILICCLLILLSCSSAQKSFKNENYSKAYQSALKVLKKGNSNKENVKILKQSLYKILEKEELTATDLKNSINLKDKTKAISKYAKMKEMILEASSFTNNEFDSKDALYSQEVENLKDELGIEYFNKGIAALEEFNNSKLKSYAKTAHLNFEKAKDYKFIDNRMDSLIAYTLDEALVTYVIEPDHPFGSSKFRIDNILKELENESDEYTIVEYNPIGIIDADCEIDIKIESLEIDIVENFTRQQLSQQIQEDSIEITVEAQIAIRTVTKTSVLDVRVRPTGNQNCTSGGSRRLSESFVEETETYNVTGDERAVPRRYRRNNNNINFEDEDDVLLELLDDLYPEIKRAIF